MIKSSQEQHSHHQHSQEQIKVQVYKTDLPDNPFVQAANDSPAANNRLHLSAEQSLELSTSANQDQVRLKIKCLIDKFHQSFRSKPQYVVCVPGRVNIIGEHIDYHGFPVLPMAIERRIWMAFDSHNNGENDHSGSLTLLNDNAELYKPWEGAHSLAYGPQLCKSHEWYHYFLSAYHGIVSCNLLGVDPSQILEHTARLRQDPSYLKQAEARLLLSDMNKRHLRVMVHSDLAPEAGLSSSSAMVCCSALVCCLALATSADQKASNPFEWGRERLAAACSHFEHLVGTRGGAMDQAVVMTAHEGYAKHVHFEPQISCDNVRLPDGVSWIVSYCGFKYAKAATGFFNRRVLETKLGAALIAKHLNIPNTPIDSSIKLSKIKRHLDQVAGTDLLAGDSTNYINGLDVFARERQFTITRICEKLGLSSEELCAQFDICPQHCPQPQELLHLADRCEHVLEEAHRVDRFRSICESAGDISALGRLMSQSHASLRDKFSCSHEALDRLVGVALDSGALGSRLTGAGWGGCIISLVEATKRATVMDRLSQISKFTFVTDPKVGSQVFKIE